MQASGCCCDAVKDLSSARLFRVLTRLSTLWDIIMWRVNVDALGIFCCDNGGGGGPKGWVSLRIE